MRLSRRRILQVGAAGAIGSLTESLLPVAKAASPKQIANPQVSPAALPQASHIALSRAGYGPDAESLAEFNKGGKTFAQQMQKYVEAQLHPDQISDKECDERIAKLNLTTLNKELAALWKDHEIAANRLRDEVKMESVPDAKAPTKADEWHLRRQPALETEMATWMRAVYSRRQLKEVITEFWHDHFSVFAYEGRQIPVFVQYDRDVIRKHAFGNFRDFLEAVAASPAMLFYLDNFVNQSGNPNENFARELFELHTLGAENYLGTKDRGAVMGYSSGSPIGYVDGDVYEAARCFTGWQVDTGKNSGETGKFNYVDNSHDRFQKIVLAKQIAELQPPLKDGRLVLDRLADHPGTARFVCKKLCRRLVSDHPSERLVTQAAAVFREKRSSPDQLAQVVRVILLSPEFSSTWGEKLKRPFESAVSLLRGTSAEFTPTEKFLGLYNRAGQRRFAWHSPDGYPDSREKWGNTTAWLEKWRFANQLLTGKIDGASVDLTRGFSKTDATPHALAEYWSLRLLGHSLDSRTFTDVVDVLAQGRHPKRSLAEDQVKERLAPGIALIAMSPEFQKR